MFAARSRAPDAAGCASMTHVEARGDVLEREQDCIADGSIVAGAAGEAASR